MAGLPYDDRDGYIWMDGEFTPWREAKVHVLTHALHYASSVFEGERAYGGVIYASRRHSERLANSARIMGFELPVSVDELEALMSWKPLKLKRWRNPALKTLMCAPLPGAAVR